MIQLFEIDNRFVLAGLLFGLLSALSLLLQKKKSSDIAAGALKSIMGFIVIVTGADLLIGSLDIFSKLFEAAFHTRPVILSTDAMTALAVKQYAVETVLILTLGTGLHLLIAKYTRFKFVFLTGHHTLFMACIMAAVLRSGGTGFAVTVIAGSAALALTMVFLPAVIQPYTRRLTGSDDIALGYFGVSTGLTAAWLGKRFGDASKSAHNVRMPNVAFLRDSANSVTLSMLIVFLAVSLSAGQKWVNAAGGATNPVYFSIMHAIIFAAGVYIVFAGIRMIINDMVPAIQRMAVSWIPGVKTSVDSPTFFPFGGNAVTVGFLASLATGIMTMFFLPALGFSVIIPGIVAHYFSGATAGMYGNLTGGFRGALIGGAVNGVAITLLPAILLYMAGTLGFDHIIFSDPDIGIAGIVLLLLLKLVRSLF